MIRLRVEQHAVELADQRVRLLATACEQAGELIVIVRRTASSTRTTPSAGPPVTRATSSNRCPRTRWWRPNRERSWRRLRDGLRARQVVRGIAAIARKDGTHVPGRLRRRRRSSTPPAA